MSVSANKSLSSRFDAEFQRLGDRLPTNVANAKRPATVHRIVKAAEAIFAERGLAGARTSAIARAARVNKALLYYYFRSKENLHQFTLEMLLNELRTQAESTLDHAGPPHEQLLRYVNSYFDFIAAHPNYPRLIQRQLMSHGAGVGGIVDDYYRPLHSRLSATIRAGITGGEFRDVDPQQTVLTLIAMTVFYFAAAPVLRELWHCDPLKGPRVAARRRAVVDFLQHGLFMPSVRTL